MTFQYLLIKCSLVHQVIVIIDLQAPNAPCDHYKQLARSKCMSFMVCSLIDFGDLHSIGYHIYKFRVQHAKLNLMQINTFSYKFHTNKSNEVLFLQYMLHTANR
jgi:hypothetical protein